MNFGDGFEMVEGEDWVLRVANLGTWFSCKK